MVGAVRGMGVAAPLAGGLGHVQAFIMKLSRPRSLERKLTSESSTSAEAFVMTHVLRMR